EREVVSYAVLLQASSAGPLTNVPEIHVVAAPPPAPRPPARPPAGAGSGPTGATARSASSSHLPAWVAAHLLRAPPQTRSQPAPRQRSDLSFAVSWQRPGLKPSNLLTQRWWASLSPGAPVYEKGHSRAVNAVAFAFNGSVLISGSDDRCALLWSC